jgi:hypothetical protein
MPDVDVLYLARIRALKHKLVFLAALKVCMADSSTAALSAALSPPVD